jgi:hypothetical protein
MHHDLADKFSWNMGFKTSIQPEKVISIFIFIVLLMNIYVDYVDYVDYFLGLY